MYQFLMPADGLDNKQFEELFRNQAEALLKRGYSVALLKENVLQGGQPLRGIMADATIVYRGWMLKLNEYALLDAAVTAAGARLLTPPSLYALTHHLPNWPRQCRSLTRQNFLAWSNNWVGTATSSRTL